MWDAQFGLDLCQDNIERYKRDECFAGTGIMVIGENNSIADFHLGWIMKG